MSTGEGRFSSSSRAEINKFSNILLHCTQPTLCEVHFHHRDHHAKMAPHMLGPSHMWRRQCVFNRVISPQYFDCRLMPRFRVSLTFQRIRSQNSGRKILKKSHSKTRKEMNRRVHRTLGTRL